jgi:hypothetical protein
VFYPNYQCIAFFRRYGSVSTVAIYTVITLAGLALMTEVFEG